MVAIPDLSALSALASRCSGRSSAYNNKRTATTRAPAGVASIRRGTSSPCCTRVHRTAFSWLPNATVRSVTSTSKDFSVEQEEATGAQRWILSESAGDVCAQYESHLTASGHCFGCGCQLRAPEEFGSVPGYPCCGAA